TSADESGSTESGTIIGGKQRSYTSGVLNGDAYASGGTLEWLDPGAAGDVGVATVSRMVVWRKDKYGSWVVALDQRPGYGTNEITVAAPPDPGSGLQLTLRTAGSAGDTGWWEAGP